MERLNKIARFFANEKLLSSGNAGVQAILNRLPASSSSESSSSSEESDQEGPNDNDFCEVIETYSDNDFKSIMRIERSTAEFLIEKFKATIPPKANSGGRTPLTAHKKFYVYMWYISHPVRFEELSQLFGISKSTAWYSVGSVAAWLKSIANEYIKWPHGTDACETAKKFHKKNGILGVIGAIGYTIIKTKAPIDNIVLQGVVDADKRFIDITCDENGSQNASTVLQKSNIYREAQEDQQTLFVDDTFIVGSSEYPLTNWLVPPFKDNGNLTEAEQNFNNSHYSTRVVAEKAFDLLKSRFERLCQFTESAALNSIVNVITSACVLHNICISFNDHFNCENEDDYDQGFNDESFEEKFDISNNHGK